MGRIENAKETYVVRSTDRTYKKILVVDDLVGSGATLNEIALKCKEKQIADEVYGLCLVGINTKKLMVVRTA